MANRNASEMGALDWKAMLETAEPKAQQLIVDMAAIQIAMTDLSRCGRVNAPGDAADAAMLGMILAGGGLCGIVPVDDKNDEKRFHKVIDLLGSGVYIRNCGEIGGD